MENILPRREARENAFLLAFSQTFGDVPLAEALTNHAENDEEHPVDGFSKLLLNAYYDHSAEVDDEIRVHLRNWTMERLPRVSLTVLRLAIAEMLFGGENKPGVAINEAVELAKDFGGEDDSPRFVNGVLGKIARSEELPGEDLYQELLAEDRAREEAQTAEAAAKVAVAQAEAGVLAEGADAAETDVDSVEE